MKAYSVVYNNDEKSIQIVRSKWLSKDKVSMVYPHPQPELDEAVMDNLDASEDWSDVSIRYLKEFGK